MRRRHQRGQALIELAVIFPLVYFVFLGSWTAAALIANNDSVAQASGYGARIGAELGNTCSVVAGTLTCTQVSGSCQENGNDPCAVDDEIISAMQPAITQLTNSKVNEIQIYQPASCVPNPALPSTCTSSGYGVPSTAVYTDNYLYCNASSSWVLQNGSGHLGSAPCYTTPGIAPYLLDDRFQTIDAEQAIGVALNFKFTSPGLSWFTQTDSAYTVITYPPEGS
ncbi:MAG: TadE family protein [Candidatus Dormiibacterota bacterium]